MEVTKELDKGLVQTLITIDPVGCGKEGFLQTVADHARRWIDVSSEGGSGWNFSNILARDIAAIYGDSAYREEISKFTREFIQSARAHEEFGAMMDEVDLKSHQRVSEALENRR